MWAGLLLAHWKTFFHRHSFMYNGTDMFKQANTFIKHLKKMYTVVVESLLILVKNMYCISWQSWITVISTAFIFVMERVEHILLCPQF